MIEARELTKRYGDKTVVDNLSFTVKAGEVTGFLGPNGAGKSTTMRMIVGLDSPTKGSVTVGGRAYARHAAPLHEIGERRRSRGARDRHTGPLPRKFPEARCPVGRHGKDAVRRASRRGLTRRATSSRA